MLGGLGLAASPTAQAQFGITLASLNTRLTAVENKTTPLAYNATSKLLTISGANVMVVDGSGATESPSGLGNLQVGYNALRNSGNFRTGSHNLIVGDQHNYSNSGGLVAGFGNTISPHFSPLTDKKEIARRSIRLVDYGLRHPNHPPNGSFSLDTS